MQFFKNFVFIDQISNSFHLEIESERTFDGEIIGIRQVSVVTSPSKIQTEYFEDMFLNEVSHFIASRQSLGLGKWIDDTMSARQPK